MIFTIRLFAMKVLSFIFDICIAENFKCVHRVKSEQKTLKMSKKFLPIQSMYIILIFHQKKGELSALGITFFQFYVTFCWLSSM